MDDPPTQGSERPAPQIDPVQASDRPLWSVMIPAYNSEDHLAAAIESVLAQDPGADRMQIEVVDDCSSDATIRVAERYADRVTVFRQPHNLGNVGNFNTCIARARGCLVHILHGDDAVRPGYYELLGEALVRDGSLGAAWCRYIAMDQRGNWTRISDLEEPEAGVLDNWLERLALGQRLQPACMTVRRSLYERIGGFRSGVSYGEDWEMWTRIAAHAPVWHEPMPLALYRTHSENISYRTLRSGENVADLRTVVELNQRLLPPERARAITDEALRITALTALRRARRLLGAGDTRGASAQLREALRTSRAPSVLAQAAFLVALRARRWLLVKLGRRRPAEVSP